MTPQIKLQQPEHCRYFTVGFCDLDGAKCDLDNSTKQICSDFKKLGKRRDKNE